MRRRWGASVCAAVSLMAAASAGDLPDENAGRFDLPLFAPSSPGFVALGLTPRRTADPGASRTFGFDAANLSNASGFSLGGAFSLEPYWFGHRDLTLKQYREQTTAWERLFARTQMSLAASYTNAGSMHAYDAGLAAQAQLLDAQDERYDPGSNSCLLQAWQSIRQPVQQAADDAVLDYVSTHPDASDEELKKVRDKVLEEKGQASEAAFARARDACRDGAALKALSRPSLMAGFGSKLRLSGTGPAGWDGSSFWATYRQPLWDQGLVSLVMFGRYSIAGRFVTTLRSRPEVKGDEATAGGGLAIEKDWWRLDLSGSYVAQRYSNFTPSRADYGEAALTGAVRFREGLWAQASVTDAFGGFNKNKPYFSFTVKYDWAGGIRPRS